MVGWSSLCFLDNSSLPLGGARARAVAARVHAFGMITVERCGSGMVEWRTREGWRSRATGQFSSAVTGQACASSAVWRTSMVCRVTHARAVWLPRWHVGHAGHHPCSPVRCLTMQGTPGLAGTLRGGSIMPSPCAAATQLANDTCMRRPLSLASTEDAPLQGECTDANRQNYHKYVALSEPGLLCLHLCTRRDSTWVKRDSEGERGAPWGLLCHRTVSKMMPPSPGRARNLTG